MRGFYIGLTPAAAWKNNSIASIFVAAATVCGAELDPPLLTVVGALTEITGDKVKASEFTKFIFDKRPEVENTRLKRMKLPVPKKGGKTVI